MTQIDSTHDASLPCWVESAVAHTEFPIQNLPLGIFSPPGGAPRGGVAIGDAVLDLRALAASALLSGDAATAAQAASGAVLNPLLALGASPRRALRAALSALLSDPAARSRIEPMLQAQSDCAMHLPASIGDYTDFYAGIHHARHVGEQLRPETPLLPNYKYLPVGYHGRASSIRVSGASPRRPNGQRKAADQDAPIFGPTRRLDYELELGVWIGPGNALGEPVPIAEAGAQMAGLCLLNDWSARDVQAWEYQPLGPFLAKNFLTTISPWIVTAEALAPYRIAQPTRPDGDPPPLPHLWDVADQAQGAFAITLEVCLLTPSMRARGMAPHCLSRGPASNLYWTIAQMITHHSSNGCNLAPGDLLGTGTISAPEPSGFGSLLEITSGGRHQLHLPNGEHRGFLEDGDEITLTGRLTAPGFATLGFGPCRGQVLPAIV